MIGRGRSIDRCRTRGGHDRRDVVPHRPDRWRRTGPGWYPDPGGAPLERWWDGTAWSADTRSTSVLARPLTRPAVIRNTPATVGLVLGVASLLVNTLLVTSLAAAVLCVLGLARAGQLVAAGYGGVGRGRAVAGLVLATVGAAATVLVKSFLF
ncbi:DUF2510 domain-containing protein [Cellulomonas sp. ATA003]|uniref:DUF2510 domain-containing protein n=1 Tax=Cellulomonas sp. ATA003 TaxID=3073064 RepID=UPI00287349D3|nr:DUF2510 domain-containing protein [Cellulomonas sp. ATA003]WNB86892.1 DUF2510 domain-containing protein [Cellulomonas sp. ATA003]